MCVYTCAVGRSGKCETEVSAGCGVAHEVPRSIHSSRYIYIPPNNPNNPSNPNNPNNPDNPSK